MRRIRGASPEMVGILVGIIIFAIMGGLTALAGCGDNGHDSTTGKTVTIIPPPPPVHHHHHHPPLTHVRVISHEGRLFILGVTQDHLDKVKALGFTRVCPAGIESIQMVDDRSSYFYDAVATVLCKAGKAVGS